MWKSRIEWGKKDVEHQRKKLESVTLNKLCGMLPDTEAVCNECSPDE